TGGMCSWPEVDDSTTNSSRTAKLELPMARQMDLPPAKVLPAALRADVLAAEEAVAAAVQLRIAKRLAATQQASAPMAVVSTVAAASSCTAGKGSLTAEASLEIQIAAAAGDIDVGRSPRSSVASPPRTTPAQWVDARGQHAEEAAAAPAAEIISAMATAATASSWSTSRPRMRRRDGGEAEAGQHRAHSAACPEDLRAGRSLYSLKGSADAAEPLPAEFRISPAHGSGTSFKAVEASQAPLSCTGISPLLAANSDTSRGSVCGIGGVAIVTDHDNDASQLHSATAPIAAAASYGSDATVANADSAAVAFVATPLAHIVPPPSRGLLANPIAVTANPVIITFETEPQTNRPHAEGGCRADADGAAAATLAAAVAGGDGGGTEEAGVPEAHTTVGLPPQYVGGDTSLVTCRRRRRCSEPVTPALGPAADILPRWLEPPMLKRSSSSMIDGQECPGDQQQGREQQQGKGDAGRAPCAVSSPILTQSSGRIHINPVAMPLLFPHGQTGTRPPEPALNTEDLNWSHSQTQQATQKLEPSSHIGQMDMQIYSPNERQSQLEPQRCRLLGKEPQPGGRGMIPSEDLRTYCLSRRKRLSLGAGVEVGRGTPVVAASSSSAIAIRPLPVQTLFEAYCNRGDDPVLNASIGSRTASGRAVERYGALLVASAGWRCTAMYDIHDALLLSKLNERRELSDPAAPFHHHDQPDQHLTVKGMHVPHLHTYNQHHHYHQHQHQQPHHDQQQQQRPWRRQDRKGRLSMSCLNPASVACEISGPLQGIAAAPGHHAALPAAAAATGGEAAVQPLPHGTGDTAAELINSCHSDWSIVLAAEGPEQSQMPRPEANATATTATATPAAFTIRAAAAAAAAAAAGVGGSGIGVSIFVPGEPCATDICEPAAGQPTDLPGDPRLSTPSLPTPLQPYCHPTGDNEYPATAFTRGSLSGVPGATHWSMEGTTAVGIPNITTTNNTTTSANALDILVNEAATPASPISPISPTSPISPVMASAKSTLLGFKALLTAGFGSSDNSKRKVRKSAVGESCKEHFHQQQHQQPHQHQQQNQGQNEQYHQQQQRGPQKAQREEAGPREGPHADEGEEGVETPQGTQRQRYPQVPAWRGFAAHFSRLRATRLPNPRALSAESNVLQPAVRAAAAAAMAAAVAVPPPPPPSPDSHDACNRRRHRRSSLSSLRLSSCHSPHSPHSPRLRPTAAPPPPRPLPLQPPLVRTAVHSHLHSPRRRSHDHVPSAFRGRAASVTSILPPSRVSSAFCGSYPGTLLMASPTIRLRVSTPGEEPQLLSSRDFLQAALQQHQQQAMAAAAAASGGADGVSGWEAHLDALMREQLAGRATSRSTYGNLNSWYGDGGGGGGGSTASTSTTAPVWRSNSASRVSRSGRMLAASLRRFMGRAGYEASAPGAVKVRREATPTGAAAAADCGGAGGSQLPPHMTQYCRTAMRDNNSAHDCTSFDEPGGGGDSGGDKYYDGLPGAGGRGTGRTSDVGYGSLSADPSAPEVGFTSAPSPRARLARQVAALASTHALGGGAGGVSSSGDAVIVPAATVPNSIHRSTRSSMSTCGFTYSTSARTSYNSSYCPRNSNPNNIYRSGGAASKRTSNSSGPRTSLLGTEEIVPEQAVEGGAGGGVVAAKVTGAAPHQPGSTAGENDVGSGDVAEVDRASRPNADHVGAAVGVGNGSGADGATSDAADALAVGPEVVAAAASPPAPRGTRSAAAVCGGWSAGNDGSTGGLPSTPPPLPLWMQRGPLDPRVVQEVDSADELPCVATVTSAGASVVRQAQLLQEVGEGAPYQVVTGGQHSAAFAAAAATPGSPVAVAAAPADQSVEGREGNVPVSDACSTGGMSILQTKMALERPRSETSVSRFSSRASNLRRLMRSLLGTICNMRQSMGRAEHHATGGDAERSAIRWGPSYSRASLGLGSCGRTSPRHTSLGDLTHGSMEDDGLRRPPSSIPSLPTPGEPPPSGRQPGGGGDMFVGRSGSLLVFRDQGSAGLPYGVVHSGCSDVAAGSYFRGQRPPAAGSHPASPRSFLSVLRNLGRSPVVGEECSASGHDASSPNRVTGSSPGNSSGGGGGGGGAAAAVATPIRRGGGLASALENLRTVSTASSSGGGGGAGGGGGGGGGNGIKTYSRFRFVSWGKERFVSAIAAAVVPSPPPAEKLYAELSSGGAPWPGPVAQTDSCTAGPARGRLPGSGEAPRRPNTSAGSVYGRAFRGAHQQLAAAADSSKGGSSGWLRWGGQPATPRKAKSLSSLLQRQQVPQPQQLPPMSSPQSQSPSPTLQQQQMQIQSRWRQKQRSSSGAGGRAPESRAPDNNIGSGSGLECTAGLSPRAREPQGTSGEGHLESSRPQWPASQKRLALLAPLAAIVLSPPSSES
ncbi:hypothetical protein Vafri_20343, partial [Volvox africanus]